MDGILTTPHEGAPAGDTITDNTSREKFANNVRDSLRQYFSQLDGEQPCNLYDMVVTELEIPLFKTVIRFTSGNQSKAAKILGISRGTLRKKMANHTASK